MLMKFSNIDQKQIEIWSETWLLTFHPEKSKHINIPIDTYMKA